MGNTLMRILLALLIFVSFSVAAHAQNEKEFNEIIEETALPENAERYAPENCEFEMIFPTAAQTTKRCTQVTDRSAPKCYNLRSYVNVYDMRTTVEINVSCVPSSPEQYARYSEPVIRAALNGMVNKMGMQEFTIDTTEENDIRKGVLIGAGSYGRQNRIYNGQLWVGQNSVLTIEAKLTGEEHSEADDHFTNILKSIKKKY
jgi:hypothetical protein